MEFFDWFFPEQAQAAHLRSLARRTQRRERRSIRNRSDINKRVDSLEDDVGYMALLLGTLIQKVDEKGLVTRAEVREAISELDAIDGVKNGRLDVNILKGMGQ
ncbi:MAG: hypothetical protein P1V35_17780 [Planctomycetota bacterium]|nr:hypothetical protein [Planctomycetota bacterium]